MILQHPQGILVDHRPDIACSIPGIAQNQRRHGAFEHFKNVVGGLVRQEQQAQRRTALAGRTEGRHHNVVDDLFLQRRGVAEHGVEAAGLSDQCGDGTILGRQALVDDPRHFGRSGEGDARAAHIGGQLGADLARTGQKMQRLGRQTSRMEEFDRLKRDKRRLFGRLGEHGVARRQGAGNLAGEDRQRKIPRADADEDAAAHQFEAVGFACRSWQRLQPSEPGLGLGRIIATVIDGLAHFGDAIIERLAALAREQCDQPVGVGFHRTRHGAQMVGARRAAKRIPLRLEGGGGCISCADIGVVGGRDASDDVAVIGGGADIRRASPGRCSGDDRGGQHWPGAIQGGDGRLDPLAHRGLAQILACRIATFRPIKLWRRGDAGMARGVGRQQGVGISRNPLGRHVLV